MRIFLKKYFQQQGIVPLFAGPCLLLWALYLLCHYLFQTNYFSWLNSFNLLMHEAGHILFYPLGRSMGILGGSLLQIIVPAIFVVYFLKNWQWMGVGFALIWLADNLFSVANYAADAQSRVLPLISRDPSTHDWFNLLNRWGILKYDYLVAGIVRLLAVVVMLTAILVVSVPLWHFIRHKQRTAQDRL
ncbi:hypothetical protein D6821_00965 [Candidatus Parcubacteria bacterium]|nr:MAG: hypothetical protein D6821_00965 [Candidatus Parcubacteria bacterium]